MLRPSLATLFLDGSGRAISMSKVGLVRDHGQGASHGFKLLKCQAVLLNSIYMYSTSVDCSTGIKRCRRLGLEW